MIERAVLDAAHGSLNIVYVFGSIVTLAGPLDPTGKHSTAQAASDIGDVIHSLMRVKLRFSAGACVDSAVNVLHVAEYPSYELLGAAVKTSRAIAATAPKEIIGFGRSLAKVLNQEQQPQVKCKPFRYSPPEPWRLRGIGSVDVVRVEDPSKPPKLLQ